MSINKPLTEVVNMFLSGVSRVANSDNKFGFNIQTEIKVVRRISSNFYIVVDLHNEESSIGARVFNNQDLEVGKTYLVYGYVYLYYKQNSYFDKAEKNGILINIGIENFNKLPDSNSANDLDVVSTVKQLDLPQMKFPRLYNKPLKIAVICPKGSKLNGAHSTNDVQSKIVNSSIRDSFIVNEMPCNIENVEEVVTAINKVSKDTPDIFVLVRGGGNENAIMLLDSPDIAIAIDKVNCFKIIGVGHAKHRLIIEMLFDHISQTPTDVANYILNEVYAMKRKQPVDYMEQFNKINDNFRKIPSNSTDFTRVNDKLNTLTNSLEHYATKVDIMASNYGDQQKLLINDLANSSKDAPVNKPKDNSFLVWSGWICSAVLFYLLMK